MQLRSGLLACKEECYPKYPTQPPDQSVYRLNMLNSLPRGFTARTLALILIGMTTAPSASTAAGKKGSTSVFGCLRDPSLSGDVAAPAQMQNIPQSQNDDIGIGEVRNQLRMAERRSTSKDSRTPEDSIIGTVADFYLATNFPLHSGEI